MIMDIPDVFFDDPDALKSCAPTTATYGIVPLGLGTPLCESLYGYLLRLAMAHRVSPYNLLMELISKSKYRSRFARFFVGRQRSWVEYYLVQMGDNARRIVEILAKATGVSTLERCTVLPLANVFTSWRLIQDNRRFCRACVANNALRYQRETLISTIRSIRACPMHEINLTETSLQKGRSFSPSELRPLYPGVCPDCGSIGHACLHARTMRASRADVWVSKQIGLLIALSSSGYKFSRNNLLEGLNELTNLRYEGKMAWLARSSDLPKTTLHSWMRKKSVPNLTQLLALCFAAEVSLAKLMCGEVTSFKAPGFKLRLRPIRRTHISRIISNKVEATMKAELRSSSTRSLTQIARLFEVDSGTITNHLPNLARRLVKRAAASRRELWRQRRLAIRMAVRTAGRRLLSRGETLSRRQFERYLHYSFFNDSVTADEIRKFKYERVAQIVHGQLSFRSKTFGSLKVAPNRRKLDGRRRAS